MLLNDFVKMDNIILLGYMGSGKSAVGRFLAQQKSFSFIDLDEYIEEKEQKTIAEIFTLKGEIYFRKLEIKYLEEILNKASNTILSLGGGTPCFGNNMDFINGFKNWKSVYLRTSIKELTERLFEERKKRPLIAHNDSKEQLSEFIAKHLFERSIYYNKALVSLQTDDKSISEIALEISDINHK